MATPDDLIARAVRLDDPAGGLAAVRELREHLARLESIHVENALRDGWRWSDVAGALGLSKQAAHRKYALTMRSRLAAADVPAGGERRLVVSDEARLTVLLARQEAEALRRSAVGTEHLLLGLTRSAATAELLEELGVTSESARGVVEGLRPEGPPGPAGIQDGDRLPLTPLCRAALAG